MKKFTIFAIILILITLIVVPFTYSYGTGTKNNTEQKQDIDEYLKIENNEVTIDDKIQVIIDINKIKYEKFKIQISTNLDNVEVEEDDVNIQEKDNAIVIELDKSQTTLKQITLNYELSEQNKIGDNILIVAEVVNIENEEENEIIEKVVKIVEKIEQETSSDNTKDSEEETLIKVKDEPETNTKDLNIEDSKTVFNQETVNTKNMVSSQSLGNINLVSSKSSENIVTYKGSDNNYLTSIKIEGYELNRDFSKENETYFFKVSEEIQSIEISALAEDDSAKVSIYGNEDLKTGTNKVLVNVTAENGNVRTYRIYVTK